MSTSRLKKVLKQQAEEVAAPVAAAGAAVIGLDLYSAIHTHDASRTAADIAAKMSSAVAIDDIAPLVTGQKSLEHDLFVTSEIQGLTAAAILSLITVPSLLKSIAYAPVKTAGLTTHVLQNWDYYLGRVLQLGGTAMACEGFIQHGKQETALETGLFCGAPLLAYLGTTFVNLNKAKHAERNVALPGGYDPLNNNSFASGGEPSAPPAPAYHP